jgi:hypothetical protein
VNWSFLNTFAIYALTFAKTFVQANASQIQAFMGKEVGYGEQAVLDAVKHLPDGQYFAVIIETAFANLGAQLPKYEGDAVAFLLAVIAAEIKRLGG